MRLVIVFLLVAFSIAVPGQTVDGKRAPLNCTTGPLVKEIGGSTWLVYACNDGKSLAVVSAPDSPASPANFIVAAKGGVYAVSGEGNGQQNAMKAAFEALSTMSSEAVVALYKEVLAAAAVNHREGIAEQIASEWTPLKGRSLACSCPPHVIGIFVVQSKPESR